MKKLLIIILVIAVIIWYRYRSKKSETDLTNKNNVTAEPKYDKGNYLVQYIAPRKFSGISGVYIETNKNYIGIIDETGKFTTMLIGSYGLLPVSFEKNEYKIILQY